MSLLHRSAASTASSTWASLNGLCTKPRCCRRLSHCARSNPPEALMNKTRMSAQDQVLPLRRRLHERGPVGAGRALVLGEQPRLEPTIRSPVHAAEP